jgi:transposase
MPIDKKSDQQDFIGFTKDELEHQRTPSAQSAGGEPKRYKRKANRGQFDCVGLSLDDLISADSPVRAIDIYVENLDLRALGFKNSDGGVSAGQPPYDPASLLRLYLYGYTHSIRSGRRLARECKINIELMWLMQQQTPNYRTITKFRSENSDALTKTHSDFVMLCERIGLIGGERVSVDGSHFRGNVSAKSFNTEESLDKAIAKADQEVKHWQQVLDEQDDKEQQEEPVDGQTVDIEQLKEELERAKKRESTLNDRLEQVKNGSKSKMSYTDPDAIFLNKRGNKTQGYNVQVVVDHHNYLIVADAVTTDVNDQRQLRPMALAVKERFGLKEFEVLADKGYYSTMAIKSCIESGITPYVAIPAAPTPKEAAVRYSRTEFTYDQENNVYVCPAGQLIKPSGKPQTLPGQTSTQRYRNKAACSRCSQKERCLTTNGKYRDIVRLVDQNLLDEHARRMEAGAQIYAERSAAVEHPFGTLKLRSGWTHFSVRGLKKVRGEWSLMVLCYNFTRVLNILTMDRFIKLCRNMTTRKAGKTGFTKIIVLSVFPRRYEWAKKWLPLIPMSNSTRLRALAAA